MNEDVITNTASVSACLPMESPSTAISICLCRKQLPPLAKYTTGTSGCFSFKYFAMRLAYGCCVCMCVSVCVCVCERKGTDSQNKDSKKISKKDIEFIDNKFTNERAASSLAISRFKKSPESRVTVCKQ